MNVETMKLYYAIDVGEMRRSDKRKQIFVTREQVRAIHRQTAKLLARFARKSERRENQEFSERIKKQWECRRRERAKRRSEAARAGWAKRKAKGSWEKRKPKNENR